MIASLFEWALILIMLVVAPSSSLAQCGNQDEMPAMRGQYDLLRQDENWSYLRNRPSHHDLWDPIKYIPLGKDGNGCWYMTIGGEAREVWEQIGNQRWGEMPYMNGYFLQRYMLSFDDHYGKHFRSFVELKSGLESFRRDGPIPIDEKKLDFQAAFLEAGTGGERNWVKFRVGRQELEYGAGHLIDVREGPNVRMSFDGVRVLSKAGDWRIDSFAMRPDEDKMGFFDNVPNPHVGLWGVYVTRPVSRSVSLDAYYLGFDRQHATFNRGTGRELRYTLGARLWRPAAKERPGWDFDDEAMWQLGRFRSGGIRAWRFASETGYAIPTIRLKPQFSLGMDISSGDNPHHKNLGTFDSMFPKPVDLTLVDTGPGPYNAIFLHPKVHIQISHGISVTPNWLFDWRESLGDGVYNVPGFLIRRAGGSQARFVGDQPGVEIHWQATRHEWFQFNYGIFYAGKFLKETTPSRNVNYWSLWGGYEF